MVNTKEKEDSFMEEMRTKEKQIVYDQALYEKAYEFAKEKHGTQKRIGGAPYITHPLAVADILKKKAMISSTRLSPCSTIFWKTRMPPKTRSAPSPVKKSCKR